MKGIMLNGVEVDKMLNENGEYIEYVNSDDYYDNDPDAYYIPDEEEYIADPYDYGCDESSYGGYAKNINTRKEFR